MKPKNQALDVWGDFACFTQPAFKVERFSYPVITPSAARGVFDAIYCKPKEFRWQVTRVEIFSPPAFIALKRNEVKEKIPLNSVFRWMEGREAPAPIFADADKALTGSDVKGRTQRQTMALKNVKYRLHAEIRPWPGFESKLQALEGQFRRRAAQGKCIYQPYFGCREFPAYFELAPVDGPGPTPVKLDIDVGWMLYDVFDLSRPGSDEDAPAVSLFRAKVRDGVMDVPDFAGPDVFHPERG
ncbi:MAG: type I-C CRISPR-associated protein Cas5c [Pseudomonadota bacterium]